MKQDFARHLAIGTTLLFVSGVLLLVSLSTFSPDNLGIWKAAKAFYGVGAILFLFDK